MSENDTARAASQTTGGRPWIAAVTTLVVLIVAATAGLFSSPDGGALVILVERGSSQIDRLASGTASTLWWNYAFLLGVVAAFNPCGFGLLPAYLGLYLNDDNARGSLVARTKRALMVSVVVAAAFTLLFGGIGALISAGSTLVSSVIVTSLPWVGLGVGVVLVISGGLILSGKSLGFVAPQRIASKFGRAARGRGIRGYAAFGLAYGLASLGCTLPLFLALLGTATAAGGPGSAVGAFALYGLGMATTLGTLTGIAAVTGVGILSYLRGLGRFMTALSAALLLTSGAYVVYYWLSAGRLLLA